MNSGERAVDRIHARNQAARLLWWWRIPYLVILAVAVAMLWITIGGVPGAMVAAIVTAVGVWVARINPWGFGAR